MTSISRTMIDELLSDLFLSAATWKDCPPPRDAVVLGSDSGDRTTLLVFPRGNRVPRVTVKIGRESARLAVANEHWVLDSLNQAVEARQVDRVFPRPMGIHEAHAFCAAAQEAIEGETLFHRMRTPPGMTTTEVAEIAERVVAAVAALGRREWPRFAGGSFQTTREEWKRCLRAQLDGVKHARIPQDGTERLEGEIARRIDALRRPVLQHGDLFPKNILLRERSGTPAFALIDWADAGLHLPPLFDAVLLLSTLWPERTGPPSEEERVGHFERVFWESTPLERLREKAFATGGELWGFPANEKADPWIVLSMAVYAARIASIYPRDSIEVNVARTNLQYAFERSSG